MYHHVKKLMYMTREITHMRAFTAALAAPQPRKEKLVKQA